MTQRRHLGGRHLRPVAAASTPGTPAARLSVVVDCGDDDDDADGSGGNNAAVRGDLESPDDVAICNLLEGFGGHNDDDASGNSSGDDVGDDDVGSNDDDVGSNDDDAGNNGDDSGSTGNDLGGDDSNDLAGGISSRNDLAGSLVDDPSDADPGCNPESRARRRRPLSTRRRAALQERPRGQDDGGIGDEPLERVDGQPAGQDRGPS